MIKLNIKSNRRFNMLFKILHGDKARISTDITPYHEGYCYVTYDGDFYVDMNNERVKLNAKDAETLTGKSLDEIKKFISYNDLLDKPVIPSIDGLATEEYVDDIASEKVDKVSGKGLSTNDYTTAEKNKIKYVI